MRNKLKNLQAKHLLADEYAIPRARGERLKRLRNLANLSRTQFCELGDFNPSTLKGWEIGRHGGLTLNGANKIIKLLAHKGVVTTIEWLLYNSGPAPTVLTDFKPIRVQTKKLLSAKHSADQKHALNELLYFRQLHPDCLDYRISDDAMLPHYQISDYVAGIKCPANQLSDLINHDVLIELDNGEILVRHLQAITDEVCQLVSLNSKSKHKTKLIHYKKISNAARIIWHRRLALA